jgi:hypothetical protein
MFYCTLYQETSGTDRVRLILAFTEEQDAHNAEKEIVRAAKNLRAEVEEHDWRPILPLRKVKMKGHINYPGPDNNEIFIFDTNKIDKVYYTVIETDKTLGKERRLYHPIKNLIIDGKTFLQQHQPILEKSSSENWYDELSDLNK